MLSVRLQGSVGQFRLDTAFDAPEAGITALFGQSGAGKTTLVNMLAGLTKPEAGRISLGDDVLFDAERGIDLPPNQRRIGYVFQESRLFPHLSVRGNLHYGRRRRSADAGDIDFDAVVRLLDIEPLLGRRVRNLSGGERQRIALGRALLASPRLLLMDEPLASLDGARKDEILPFIERLRDDYAIPIVYVTHAMEELIRLADLMVIVDRGRIAASGPVEELMSRLDLRPLTGRFEAGSVLAVSVSGQDPEFGLTRLAFAGGEFQVPAIDAPIGQAFRLRVRARDVSLALSRPDDISVLNVFAGTVAEIGDPVDGEAQLDVKLDIGAPLWARITRKSVAEMGLVPGKKVHALIKAVSIDRRSAGLRPDSGAPDTSDTSGTSDP